MILAVKASLDEAGSGTGLPVAWLEYPQQRSGMYDPKIVSSIFRGGCGAACARSKDALQVGARQQPHLVWIFLAIDPEYLLFIPADESSGSGEKHRKRMAEFNRARSVVQLSGFRWMTMLHNRGEEMDGWWKEDADARLRVELA